MPFQRNKVELISGVMVEDQMFMIFVELGNLKALDDSVIVIIEPLDSQDKCRYCVCISLQVNILNSAEDTVIWVDLLENRIEIWDFHMLAILFEEIVVIVVDAIG